MLIIHLRRAWRHIIHEKKTLFLPVAGLAIGLAACIGIALFITSELSYDRFNTKADRIFRIAADVQINGGTLNYVAIPPAMAAALVKDFPNIETAVRIRQIRHDVAVHVGDKTFSESGAVLADSSLFDVFTLPLLDGNPKIALAAPNSLVLSATTAKKYFNTLQVVGRTLKLDEDTTICTITAVMQDMPATAHFHFPLIRSLQQRRQEWVNFFASTYVLARPGTGTADLDRMLAQTVDRYVIPQVRQQLRNSLSDLKKNGDRFRYYAVPLTRIHLYSRLHGEFEPNGDIRYVVLFAVAGVLILLMAAINFINLSIAHGIKRMQEIGVRKVLGSSKRKLVAQFALESVLLTTVAMTIALALLLLTLPGLDHLTGRSIDRSLLLSKWFTAGIPITTLLVGLLAGSYTALLLAGVEPLTTLRGEIKKGFRTGALRTALLVFQFTVAMVLIIGTGVIDSQLYFIRHRDPGYHRAEVMTIKDTRALGEGVWSFAAGLGQLRGVMKVTVSGNLPEQKVDMRGFFKDRSAKETATALLGDWKIDANYLPTLDIKLVEGRNFSPQLPTDSAAALINETAARFLGYAHPIGEKIYTGPDASTEYRIIGVVRDFNTGSLHDPIDPLAFRLDRDGSAVTLRLSPGNMENTIKSIQSRYERIANGHPFTYSFLDDDFNQLYVSDQLTGDLFTAFAFLAMGIAGMGMLGLVAATVGQRTRELGVRRVLGARLGHLVLLLSKEYAVAIGLAVTIALPAGAWIMHHWLQDFALRTTLHAWIFVVSPLTAIGLALSIITAKAGAVSRSSLANTLRTE